eukprot:TRINITY_DN48139_c0_g1_i1.p2 TRINITY_DN48139_c0_g1~~TRINITY_DN48139_c0_g1_i1.p2  ORF type:complete len:120 (-),score=13.48 TRINITY_DN48139_c0_g1_i1:13-327(-)
MGLHAAFACGCGSRGVPHMSHAMISTVLWKVHRMQDQISSSSSAAWWGWRRWWWWWAGVPAPSPAPCRGAPKRARVAGSFVLLWCVCVCVCRLLVYRMGGRGCQ